MRRPARLGLAAAILLIVGLAAYSGVWWYAAGRVRDGLAEWAQSVRQDGVTVAWQDMHVSGYPLALRVELSGFRLNSAAPPSPELRAPVVIASTRPWNYRLWQVAAPSGLNATFGSAAQPLGRVAAQAGTGWVRVGNSGGLLVWLGLSDASAETLAIADGRATAEMADFWIIVPPQAPDGRHLAVAAELRRISVPMAPPSFSRVIDELAFGVTVRGAIPSGPPREAAAAWRKEGGTVELDRFRLAWGSLGITASGTLALDQELQPVGGFSGAVSGYDELLSALVAAGRLKEGDARLARIGLAMVSKAGPDGRPQITTSFTIQNGEMYFGPAKLGPVPRITW